MSLLINLFIKKTNNMKKIIPIFLAALAFTACEKDPDLDNLDNEYLVITNYDAKAPFSSFQTFYMPDSILLVTDKAQPEYWTSETNQEVAQILSCYKKNMETLYTEAPNKETADIGLQISYIASTYYFTSWNNNPWWYDYPGYWDYAYWGGWWGGWYYPYPITFSYNTGSYIAELINLQTGEKQPGKKLNVVWSSDISGWPNAKGNLNLTKTLTGINQAFTQSPYLKATHK